MNRLWRLWLVALLAATVTACAGDPPVAPPPDTTTTPPPPPPPPVVMVGAGDTHINCTGRDSLTVALLDSIPGLVFTAGDNAKDGSASSFADCYAHSWGRHRARIRPAAGNHDYDTPGAAGYYAYFGLAAGDPAKGYYSYDYGRWHVVVLNSNLPIADTSAQLAWLRQDLAASSRLCALAYFHHPRFSSGRNHGNQAWLEPAWQVMHEFGVEVAVVGHDHVYERFAPQTAAGVADSAFGIRQFTAGMGGSDSTTSYQFGTVRPNSEFRENRFPGMLKLSLDSADYRWEFVAAPSANVIDQGRGTCHGRSPSAAGRP